MRPVALLLVMSACDAVFLDERADVDAAGTYTLTVTAGANGCMFENWRQGETSVLEVMVMQERRNVTATVGGVAGLIVQGVTGQNLFTGTVDEDTLSLGIVGTQVHTMLDCMMTIDYELSATLDGDVLVGELRSRAIPLAQTAACAPRVGCTSLQSLLGMRP